MVAIANLAQQQTESCGVMINQSPEDLDGECDATEVPSEFVLYKGLRVYKDGKIERRLKRAGWREIPNKVNCDSGYNCIKMYDKKSAKRHRIIKAAYTPEFDIKNPKHVVDHINHDKIDNSLNNLRVVTQQGNQWNRRGKGYSFNKKSGKYQVNITINNKVTYIGSYKTKEEARDAYLLAKEKYHVITALC